MWLFDTPETIVCIPEVEYMKDIQVTEYRVYIGYMYVYEEEHY